MRNRTWLLLVVGLASLPVLQAQDISGSIAGVVQDPSGASIPDAKITITNTARHQVVRTLTTDTGGNYSAPLIPVGTYSIKVEASGFRTMTREDVVLNVNDQLKINLTMEVGANTEEVTVREAPVSVELGTAAAAGLIEGKQIRELSLSSRNYEQLVALMPGVTSSQTDQLYVGSSLPSGLANVVPFSINGQRNSANNWTIDGADNVDRGSNLTLLNYPSVDAIEQFKVLRSLYTADTGRAGGAQINVVTKSGNSQFHGDLYEFVRNDALAANNFINNMNGIANPPLRYNNFGYTVGGPVYIPGHFNKEKNKTFFFFSQEFRRVITYTTFTATVPTADELKGNFVAPVCVASSGSTCTQTASQISSINPIAAQYINDIYSKIALPTSGNTLVTPERNVFNHRQELVRIDHTFNDKFSIWGRYLNDSIPTTEPGGLFTGSALPNGATTNTNAPGRSIVVHGVNVIRPNLLNEAGYNFSRGAILSTPVGLTSKDNAPDVQPTLPFANTLGVIPELAFSGAASAVVGVGPYNEYSRNHNFFDNLTLVKGRHTMRFGVSLNRYQKTENSPNGNNYGTFTFGITPRPTGTSTFEQAWANFLLGNVATFTQASADFAPNLHAWQWEAYAQDDFRVSPRLTLSLGVRYSNFMQPVDDSNRLTNFDPSTYSAAKAPQIDPTTGNLVAGTGTTLNGIIIGGQNSPFGDRISNNNNKDFAPRIGIAWDPTGSGKTSIRSGYGIYYDASLFGTYEQNIFANPPFIQSINISNTRLENAAAGTPNVSLSPLALRGTPLPNMTPYTQQWSLDVQRQLGSDFVVDVGYYGSKSTHLLGIIDINQAYPGVALAAGLHSGAGTSFTTADDPRINAVRPYLGYNAINVVEPWFDSNYHSLQVSIQKNFGSAGMFNLSYTWSKNLTDNWSDRSNAAQNSYNFHEGEYGPAQLDRRQVLTFNYVYDIPIFKQSKGWVAYALKGWEVSGNTQYGTGLPTTATTSGADPAGLGLLGSSAASGRPDMVCDPNQDAPHQLSQWFNTACFQNVPSGEVRPGNEGRGVIRMPGFGRWDVSLFKNFQFHERYQLQVRGETFNFLNHGNPSGFGSLTTSSSLFGKITSFRDPRIIQLGAKLYF
ncbi:MAG TPA: carboxypeptidase regulatory-like domain-containing protein [Bryobacteraceae bacterium]|nr:carboxypeptidase regulatory-like domain-containing protein [Bryobacteraceae bacterium]